MLGEQEIRSYYKDAKLILKPNSNWRLYKMQLRNGCWIKIKNQIREPEQLREILIKETPINVFSSTSSWLNPLNVEHPSYKYADRVLLGNLVFIDIDEHNNKVFNEVLEYFERNPRYKFWKAKDSGNGYGIYYEDTKKISIKDPHKRIRWLRLERIKLLMDMVNKGITAFDWRMVIDPFRISRVIGTLNEGEKVCKEINAPLQVEDSPERPKADERGRNLLPYTPPTEYQRSAPTGLGASAHFYIFIDSQIYGIKDKHCAYIMKRKEFSYPRFVKLLKKLQECHKLSDFYVFETEKHYAGLCLKGVDRIKFLRILRYAKATNLNSFQKYRHSWIRTSNIVGNDESDVEEKPKFIEVIEKPEYRHHFHSRPHIDYLDSLGVQVKDYNNLFGSNKNKQLIAKVKV